MEVNVNKTNIMIFGKNRNKKKNIWKYKENILKEVKEINYLGLLISNNGTWKRHVEEVITKGKRMVSEIRKYMLRYQECPKDLIEKIFTAIIEPTILYGAEVRGISKEARVVDKVICWLAKQFLGVKSNTPSLAAMKELGWNKTSSKAIHRAINYYRKNSIQFNLFTFVSPLSIKGEAS